MGLRPLALENPERDAPPLRNRVEVDQESEPQRGNGRSSATEQLRAFRDRIDAARKLKPQGRDLHCADCFRRGRDAALRAVEGIGET